MNATPRILAGDAVWSPAGGLRIYSGGAGALLDGAGQARETGSLEELVKRGLPVNYGPGLVMPGMVDAHAHLELGALAGRVPGGSGLAAWVARLMAERSALTDEDLVAGARAAARSMRASGTVAVADVATVLATATILREAGLAGLSLLEVVGASEEAGTAALGGAERRAAQDPGDGRVTVQATPHSAYGTSPGTIVALSGDDGARSVHAAEHVDEDAWLVAGEGPLAPFLRSKGGVPPGVPAVRLLDSLGAVGKSTLLVHLVTASTADLELLRRRGATAVLCPRSNLHIGGRLASLPAIRHAGVPFALGTDSLASTPDHDLLGEVRVLAESYPDIPIEELLEAATLGGAAALGLPAPAYVRTSSPHARYVVERLRRRERAIA